MRFLDKCFLGRRGFVKTDLAKSLSDFMDLYNRYSMRPILANVHQNKVHFVRVLVLFDELNYAFPLSRTMLS